MDLRSPVGVIGALLGVRENYPKEVSSHVAMLRLCDLLMIGLPIAVEKQTDIMHVFYKSRTLKFST